MRIDEMEALPADHPLHVPPPGADKKQKQEDDDDDRPSFKVGQRITVTGGKHQKLIQPDEVCVVSTVKSTFCEIQISGPDSIHGRKANVHRKFIKPVEEVPEPVVVQEPEEEGVFHMPTKDDCVVVERQEETTDKQGETSVVAEVKEIVKEVVKDVAFEDPIQETIEEVTEEQLSDKDEIVRLKGVIADLEADIVSYRDMMLGHQNELEFLRRETGPTQEEKKLKNEKVIECIKILLSIQ